MCDLLTVAFGLWASRSGRADGSRHDDGQTIFRYDTFGDEQLWTNVLRMHEVIQNIDPATALAVGLKVDVDTLPPTVTAALRKGAVDLADPAVTTELLRVNAVVGFISLNSSSLPVLIPPIYGLKGVGFETYTADGPISYWYSYVGVSQMGGHGSFSDRGSGCPSGSRQISSRRSLPRCSTINCGCEHQSRHREVSIKPRR
jgi:hypothetical protein